MKRWIVELDDGDSITGVRLHWFSSDPRAVRGLGIELVERQELVGHRMFDRRIHTNAIDEMGAYRNAVEFLENDKQKHT